MTIIFILLVVTAIWAAFAAWLSKIVTSSIPSETWRMPVAVLIFAALLPLPLLDEIVGARQFEQLCRENSTIRVDRVKAVGKTVYFTPQPNVEIGGTWVHITLRPQRFVELTSGEPVLTYNELVAGGGWLIRSLGISEGGVPLTFRGACVPANRPGSVQTFRPYGINYVEPPMATK